MDNGVPKKVLKRLIVRYWYGMRSFFEDRNSKLDTLYRFCSKFERDSWARANRRFGCSELDEGSARRWWPEAFSEGDRWGEPDESGAMQWHGLPTGGLYYML